MSPSEAAAELGITDWQENYEGCWTSWDTFVRQYLSEAEQMEEWPLLAAEYFDFDLFAIELQKHFLVHRDLNQVHVFLKPQESK